VKSRHDVNSGNAAQNVVDLRGQPVVASAPPSPSASSGEPPPYALDAAEVVAALEPVQ
jgi:hypothetical protein